MELAQDIRAPFGDLERTFGRQRELSRAEAAASLEQRRDRLTRLAAVIERDADALVAAMSADFGHRATHESETYDIAGSLSDIRHDLRNVGAWMRPRRYPVRGYMWPGRAKVLPTPLGVVGVMSPWNFPVYLAVSPLSAALAAGNRVLVKPSEHTPRTSALLAELLERSFSADEVRVFCGGPDLAERFAALPFDHLLFTGSVGIGRRVAVAAAHNLTPVTLELGGKSPLVVAPSADLDDAASRCMFGKLANAGQICVSPDYALVPRAQLQAFVERASAHAHRLYPSFVDNPDYSAMLGAERLARLEGMIAEAERKGARVVKLGAAGGGKLGPVLVLDPAEDTRLMQEEIFGPVLPVVGYSNLDDAIGYINRRARPLALYLFVRDRAERESVLSRTVSGGVTVNDVIYHVGCNTLPFGGVGASGTGAYHGEAGFQTFSHLKPVFYQTRLNGRALFETPRTPFRQAFGRFFRRIV
jgi:acyl-CoA reductase-like NAD-dependent aldehyde dehydrogenase